jgi:hypothetical protein
MERYNNLQCDNCEKQWSEKDLKVVWPNIPKLAERTEPGQEIPHGECPDCGMLVYLAN